MITSFITAKIGFLGGFSGVLDLFLGWSPPFFEDEFGSSNVLPPKLQQSRLARASPNPTSGERLAHDWENAVAASINQGGP